MDLFEVSLVHTDAEPGTMDAYGAWASDPSDQSLKP